MYGIHGEDVGRIFFIKKKVSWGNKRSVVVESESDTVYFILLPWLYNANERR